MAKLKIWSLTYLEARFPAPLMKWVGDRPLSIFFFVPSARWGTWLVFRLCAKPNWTNNSSSNTPSLLAEAAEDEHEFWLAGKNSGRCFRLGFNYPTFISPALIRANHPISSCSFSNSTTSLLSPPSRASPTHIQIISIQRFSNCFSKEVSGE